MPGFDGTGPRGLGPMTGGGRGFCAPGARRFPYRRAYPAAYASWQEGDVESLKAQIQEITEELKQVEARVNELQSE